MAEIRHGRIQLPGDIAAQQRSAVAGYNTLTCPVHGYQGYSPSCSECWRDSNSANITSQAQSRQVLRDAVSNAQTILSTTPDDPAYTISADALASQVLRLSEYLRTLDAKAAGPRR